MLIPIIDCQKNPTSQDQEDLRPNQSIYDEVACTKHYLEYVKMLPLPQFSAVLCTQTLLDEEQAILLSRKVLQDTVIKSDSEGEGEREEESEFNTDVDDIASVFSTTLQFVENQDFMQL